MGKIQDVIFHPVGKISIFLKLWAVLTAVYVFFEFAGASSLPVLVVGLFVPYGFWNTMFALASPVDGNYLPLLPLAFIIIFGLWSDKLFTRMGFTSKIAQVIASLLILLALTFLTDWLIYGDWISMKLLLNGGDINLL